MALSHHPYTLPRRPERRYVRPPVPLFFPVEEEVPESKLHRLLMSRLWDSVERELGDHALIASDQFLYWDATDPKKCLAPDVAIRVGARNFVLDTWKTWELGAPHVGVEIVSDTDASEKVVETKLARYRQAGIGELVRFDPTEPDPLRIWDWIEGDMVERDPTDPAFAACDALGLYWCLRQEPQLGLTLRLARDRAGADLLLTSAEAERAAKEAERAAKDAALARVAELEAELARRR
jgi:hypothetical protein